MNRLWSRVGIRAASVGLLVAGVIGGVYLGQDREVQAQSAAVTSSQAKLVDSRAEVEEIQLLKERQAQHAAARAYRRAAEGAAASEAMAQAKTAAGKARTEAQKAIEKEAAEKAAKAEKSGSGSSGGSTAYTGPIPDSCNEYSGTRETGCALMIDAGFGIDQFPCLDKLWKKESGWNPKAANPSSGAYGIPQALPGSKMGSVADDWRTNPATQIKWGLGYIEGRYDTPCGAWSHSQSTGWY
ncbi:transglycosylase SLT domain-containing protein [Actinoplanes sp. NPDC049316]|uniref:aggregation-promoting factor C-terminal-like domain-containing protein n=1 Tax=Actinoplanes sp. NPDC049316 TaxID=3154727 RepID=UPI00341AE702